MKCDICKKNKPKEFCVTECPDCYMKGCKSELGKQRKDIIERLKKIEEESCSLCEDDLQEYIKELEDVKDNSHEKPRVDVLKDKLKELGMEKSLESLNKITDAETNKEELLHFKETGIVLPKKRTDEITEEVREMRKNAKESKEVKKQ